MKPSRPLNNTGRQSFWVARWPPPIFLPPWAAWLVPFFLSPVMLSVMYLTMLYTHHPAVQHRGLYEFYSASYGDFILLPAGWVFMCLYYRAARKAQVLDLLAWPRYAGIIIGVALAAVIVTSSVYGDGRDWTLPEVGKINFPGVYHALFMGFMLASFFSFLFDHMNITLKHHQKRSSLPVNLVSIYWVIIFVLSCFLVLLWLDGLYQNDLSFFQSNPPMQIAWSVFLVMNIVILFWTDQKPFSSRWRWLLYSCLVLLFLVLLVIWLG